MHARTSVRMTGKIEHPISNKVLEDKRRREHDGKKRGRLRQGGAVTIVIYLNKRLIIQTNSTFPGRERGRSRARPHQEGNSLDL